MYLLETGIGRPTPSRETDVCGGIIAFWTLKVPFRIDYGDFRREVVKRIQRYVGKEDQRKIDGLLNNPDLIEAHRKYLGAAKYTDSKKRPHPNKHIKTDFVDFRVHLHYEGCRYRGSIKYVGLS